MGAVLGQNISMLSLFFSGSDLLLALAYANTPVTMPIRQLQYKCSIHLSARHDLLATLVARPLPGMIIIILFIFISFIVVMMIIIVNGRRRYAAVITAGYWPLILH